MPLAAALLAVARAGGGTGAGARSHYSNLFLVLHVGLVLAAFAGFTLAAALSALYLWQERRLKRREATILRRPAPSLATLDRARRAHGRVLAARADARYRRRPRPPAHRRRPHRRARRRHARDLGRLVGVSRAARDARLDRPSRRLRRAGRLRARHRRAARPSGGSLRMMRLVLVGTSHHHAPRRAARARRARSRASARCERSRRPAAKRCASRPATARSSTSPRRTSRRPSERAVAALAELEPEVEPALYRLRDEAAALHLFRVAAGLDSLVPGEGEILGQVRAAYEAGTTGVAARPRLPPGAARRQEGAGADGDRREPASVSSAAAALAEQVFGDLDGLLDPARRRRQGQRAGGAEPRSRAARDASSLTRRPPSGRLGRSPLDARGALGRADVVVSSTSAPGFVLDAATVERALRAAGGSCS